MGSVALARWPAALLAAIPLAGLPACVDTPPQEPAGWCAEVVRIVRDLQKPVAVVGQPRESSEGGVEIEYEGMDVMNLPVKGRAACRFAVGEGGRLTLQEAVVDGSPLAAGAIESIGGRLAAER